MGPSGSGKSTTMNILGCLDVPTGGTFLFRGHHVETLDRDQRALLRRLAELQYTRNDIDFTRGTFRVRGDTVEIIPMYEELAIRIEFFGDEIEALYYLHPLTGDTALFERVCLEGLRAVDEPVEDLEVAGARHVELLSDRLLLGAGELPPLPLERQDVVLAS